ncbi:hypothetical protein TNCT_650611 [Trichonephila clavata]|uniref:Uncharacterized protein n=1 Tax=Trichonephila clavata TaxID=2740835 RepID=A0A8X6I335_TRICU|nr:hypothetical protein TNCT_650611 [Trichonephila clavata]
MPLFTEILIFLVGMEIMKNYISNQHCTFQIETEKPQSLDVTVVINDNTAFPQTRSKPIYAICRSLDLKTELVYFHNYNQVPAPTILKEAHSSNPPAVYSFTLCLRSERHWS